MAKLSIRVAFTITQWAVPIRLATDFRPDLPAPKLRATNPKTQRAKSHIFGNKATPPWPHGGDNRNEHPR